jgi:GMP synthase (glutamine-hydrolysing)
LKHQTILILDCGSGDSLSIARQIRDFNVFCEIHPCDLSISSVKSIEPAGIILVGDQASKVNSEIFQLDIPVLGIGVDCAPQTVPENPDPGVLKNFLIDVCNCETNWTMKSFIKSAVHEIKEQVGNGRAICGLSGGIDSAVAAALVHQAIGDQLTCIYVDHGFMRKGETEQIIETFQKQLKMNLIHIDARERFVKKIAGITDPEQKRKIIGNEFVRVFEEEAAKIGDAKFLVQGTLYADIVESGTSQKGVIKSHHNVGGLPEDMELELVEPLKSLFKDEVRILAQELGLPEEIVWRHPFPGPGLAIRILGEIDFTKLEILREVDAIIIEEIKKAGLYRQIWQAFGVLTNARTVGVLDDERTYDYVVAVRAVTSEDAMTAQWFKMPYEVLDSISRRVMHEVKGVNRVVYDISSKPPATIEWE